MSRLLVIKAEYLDGYRLRIAFSDGTTQVIDFEPFLMNHPHPQHNKYRRLSNFQKFRIERGNIVWGQDWDMIFPISQLHQGRIAPAVY